MKPRQRRSFVNLAAAVGLLAGFLTTGETRGENLVTLSGATYRDARPVSVEPDGVIWRHAEGVVKVDFADSPKSVCEAYHYDPVKAAAYHDAQTRTRQQANEQTQQLLQESEARQRARMEQAQAAAASAISVSTSPASAELIFRRAKSPAASAAAKALGEQMAADNAKQAAALADATGIGNAKIWSLAPRFGTRRPVISTDAPNTEEYKASMCHPVSGFVLGSKDPALDTTQDPFYKPIYLTKSYYETIDQAAAFANGVPLKP